MTAMLKFVVAAAVINVHKKTSIFVIGISTLFAGYSSFYVGVSAEVLSADILYRRFRIWPQSVCVGSLKMRRM